MELAHATSTLVDDLALLESLAQASVRAQYNMLPNTPRLTSYKLLPTYRCYLWESAVGVTSASYFW